MSRNAWRTPTVAIRDGRGPERVVVEEPPPDWTPPPPVGFVPRPKRVDPLLWDGDQG